MEVNTHTHALTHILSTAIEGIIKLTADFSTETREAGGKLNYIF